MADILKIVRNAGHQYTYHDLRPYLVSLHQLCYTLGLDKRRLAVESIVKRSDDLIHERGDASLVLQLITDWIPDPRSRHAAALKTKDRSKMDKLWKARGGHSSASIVAALQGSWGGGAMPAPTLGGSLAQPAAGGAPLALSFPAVTPQAAGAPFTAGMSLGSLTLPLASKQQGKQGNARGTGAQKRGRSKGGKGRSLPAGVPSTQQAQDRADYNNQLKALQQAALPHPNGYHCSNCAGQGRTAHHTALECAYTECHNCQRGGHRSKFCVFPKYP